MDISKIRIRQIAFGFTISAVVAVLLSVGGCEKASHNGDLDGQWQVMEVLHGDQSVDMPEGERYYYCIYLHTVLLKFTDRSPFGLVGNMTFDGNTLHIDFPYLREGRVDPYWIQRLDFWGISEDPDVTFRIRELTRSRLVMQRDSVTVVCRKF